MGTGGDLASVVSAHISCSKAGRCHPLLRGSRILGYFSVLGYLKDDNVAAHSVDSDIFYPEIHLAARSKTYIKKNIS